MEVRGVPPWYHVRSVRGAIDRSKLTIKKRADRTRDPRRTNTGLHDDTWPGLSPICYGEEHVVDLAI